MPYDYYRDKWLKQNGYTLQYIPTQNASLEGESFDVAWAKQEKNPFVLINPDGSKVTKPRAEMRQFLKELFDDKAGFKCPVNGCPFVLANPTSCEDLEDGTFGCGVSNCTGVHNKVITYELVNKKAIAVDLLGGHALEASQEGKCDKFDFEDGVVNLIVLTVMNQTGMKEKYRLSLIKSFYKSLEDICNFDPMKEGDPYE